MELQWDTGAVITLISISHTHGLIWPPSLGQTLKMRTINKMFAWGKNAASGPQRTGNVIDRVEELHPGKHKETFIC